MKRIVSLMVIALMLSIAVPLLTMPPARPRSTGMSWRHWKSLYESTPAAKKLAEMAKGILVFPSIVKGGSSSAASTVTEPLSRTAR